MTKHFLKAVAGEDAAEESLIILDVVSRLLNPSDVALLRTAESPGLKQGE